MLLEAGQTLLHYRIVDKIGEGGMGVVWRAEDTALGREVAIKVLPTAWAGDVERLQRFEREARLLASLNHPNVATVHGLHEVQTPDGAMRFIAMELVPGEDLAARLKRGPLELDRALQVAQRIARGLEAAHAAGIVHRDLKPANVRLTPDDKIKVLDFGLAKAGAAGTDGDPHLSPTLTSAGTQAGVVLGTAAYMSPEQAKGLAVDRRADIWAFGVVLFEMLSGQRAFRGDGVADTMASVMKLEPNFDELPADTPPAVRRVLRRCLRKDPQRRLRDIGDACIELEETDLEAPPHTATGTHAGTPVARRPLWFLLPLAAAAGLVAGALAWWALDGRKATLETSRPEPVRRAVIPLPEGRPLNRGDSIAISPDGAVIAMTAGLDGESRLYVRRLDSLEIRPIPGTDGATSPFFSPAGDEVGFFADGQLKKVSLRGPGNELSVLCDAPTGTGAAWDDRGQIYFIYGESRLARVAGTGSEPTELGDVANDVFNVHALPEGRGILLTLRRSDSPSTRKDVSDLAVLLPDDRTLVPVLEGGYSASYLSAGYLVFMRLGGLYAVGFDLETFQATSRAVSVQPGVVTDSMWGTVLYDVSRDGSLVFASGGDFARSKPTWIDLETGEEDSLPIPPGVYNTFNLSPDGTRLAIQNLEGAREHISIYDARGGTFTRLTEQGANSSPVWSYDGREVLFASNRDGELRLFRKAIDGSAPASRLLTAEQEAQMGTTIRWPKTVTPDGKYLLIDTWAHPTQGGDLWKVPLDGGDPEVVLATETNEIIPQVSPDGKWLSYMTNRTGDYRVVVRALDGDDLREWIVSGPDGYDQRWTPEGDALLFREGWGRLMRVPVIEDGVVRPGMAQEVFEIDFHDSSGASFAVSPDGKRVLVNKPVGVSMRDETPITLVTGWAQEVARTVGAD